MRPEHSASTHDEPIDWFAEFDSESESENRQSPSRTDDLAMFPSEAMEDPRQPAPEQPPLFRVLPPAPPTGPQRRHGDPLGDRPTDPLDVVIVGLDRAAKRLPRYRTAIVAQLRRRRAVFIATAAILVVSTAAMAGSVAMRRRQRASVVTSQQTADASRSTPPAPESASGASSTPAAMLTPTPQVATATNAATPRPSPTVAAARAATTSVAVTDRAAAVPTPRPTPVVSSNPPPTLANRAVGSVASLATIPATTSLPEPPPSPTPTATPTRTSTASPTPTPTATSAPAAPPRTTPAARDDARVSPTATPTASPEAVETALVQGVLDRYRRTFDSLSVDDVTAFWPSVNVRSLSRAFDQLASQHLTFEGCTIALRGHQADATCHGRAQFVPKVGSRSPHVENRQWAFLLLRSDSGWTITRVDVK